MVGVTRFAFVTGVDHRERLLAYLPASYAVLGEGMRDGRSFFVIGGTDSAGWTLDGYVIPRLASGLIFAEEVDEAAARAVVASSSRPGAYIGLPNHREAMALLRIEQDEQTARNLDHVTSLPSPDVLCEECGEPIVEDASPGVWLHDPDLLGDEAYDLNEDHAAYPPEGVVHSGEAVPVPARRPRPDFDMRVDYPERFSDGPY